MGNHWSKKCNLNDVPNTSKQNHVQLTGRDFRLLALLYDHCLMDLGQIERFVFPQKSTSTILNRIGKLEKSGFLKRIRISRLIHPGSGRNVGVVLQITQKGLKEIAKHHPEKHIHDSIPDIHLSQLDHDLLLVDVIERLKTHNPDAAFTDGKRFVKGKSDIHRVPDSVMECLSTMQKTAIELELTAKSEKRYRQIILAYRLMPHFEKVLFIASSHSIAQKIKSEITGFKGQTNENLETGKFEFKLLKDFLN